MNNTLTNIETLSASANRYARRALRALEAGDIDACATYTALELQARAALGDFVEDISHFVGMN